MHCLGDIDNITLTYNNLGNLTPHYTSIHHIFNRIEDSLVAVSNRNIVQIKIMLDMLRSRIITAHKWVNNYYNTNFRKIMEIRQLEIAGQEAMPLGFCFDNGESAMSTLILDDWKII